MDSTEDISSIISSAVAALLSQQSGIIGKFLNHPEYNGIGSPQSLKSCFDRCINLFDAFEIKDQARRVANLRLQFRGTAETSVGSYSLMNPTVMIDTTKLF
ncbi:hypothetical protein AYI70_g7410 [Smittium culicis]|uniref:Uncharacterized protein n=1 Tax=Smittium culicis TaxID=133412 RepID=A0A1R1XKU0_9FUNG|nr:hypothetical protein AYI70_g7410 [Smittium culicis]